MLTQAVEEGHTSSGLVFTKVWFCSLDKCDLLMVIFWQTRVEIVRQQDLCIICCFYISISHFVVYILDFLLFPFCVKMQTGIVGKELRLDLPKKKQGNM